MNVNQQPYRTIWANATLQNLNHENFNQVCVIDQTQLPHKFEIVAISNVTQMIQAIKTMQVRGAPLIGAAAAYGMALATQHDANDAHLITAANLLIQSRPTAVNLQWAVSRMQNLLINTPLDQRNFAAWREAAIICDEDVALNFAIGAHGLSLIEAKIRTQIQSQTQALNKASINILTHCNAGWLATVDVGTALAPIYAAHDAGISVHVWVGETRPRNQGASLTAWELAQHGVPHTVISDNAGGHLMQQGKVDMVIVGADRVTADGDVCNKIGTYLKALAAFDNHVPFYAAVPSPTIDWAMSNGKAIEIEERSGDEVRLMQGKLANGEITEINILPVNTKVANPAFDVTPARLVTGIITEQGVYTPANLKHMIKN